MVAVEVDRVGVTERGDDEKDVVSVDWTKGTADSLDFTGDVYVLTASAAKDDCLLAWIDESSG